jgi:hypothetical protein
MTLLILGLIGFVVGWGVMSLVLWTSTLLLGSNKHDKRR